MESFIYYTHPWMVQEFFQGSASCGRPVSACNQTDVAAVEMAIRAGMIAWHAKPFTMIHELCDPEIFEWSLNISRELSARFGVSHGQHRPTSPSPLLRDNVAQVHLRV